MGETLVLVADAQSSCNLYGSGKCKAGFFDSATNGFPELGLVETALVVVATSAVGACFGFDFWLP